MGLRYDSRTLHRLEQRFEKLASGRPPEDLAHAIEKEVRGLLKEQFAAGIDPAGNTYKPLRSGKPAFYKKMRIPQDFRSATVPQGVLFYGRIRWLDAHQHGHVFPARKVAANKNYLTFNSKGKLVAERRIFRKTGEVRKGGYQVFARAHEIGKRVLPQRMIYPEGALPKRWDEALERGAEAGMEEFFGEFV
jgi:hypothetical protein